VRRITHKVLSKKSREFLLATMSRTRTGAGRIKGRMQEGMDADIVVFNPDTVRDNSTYEPGMGAIPSTGIPYVLVNGVVVVKDSKVQKVFPGKPIRFPVLAKGRLDQINIEPRVFVPNQ